MFDARKESDKVEVIRDAVVQQTLGPHTARALDFCQKQEYLSGTKKQTP